MLPVLEFWDLTRFNQLCFGSNNTKVRCKISTYITLPQTKREYTEYTWRQRQSRRLSEWGSFILRHKVINFICMLDVLQLYYDNPNMSFFCLSENYKNFPFHLKTPFSWYPTYVFGPSRFKYFKILSLTKQWLIAIFVFNRRDSRQA